MQQKVGSDVRRIQPPAHRHPNDRYTATIEGNVDTLLKHLIPFRDEIKLYSDDSLTELRLVMLPLMK
jgi:hypothetical protein